MNLPIATNIKWKAANAQIKNFLISPKNISEIKKGCYICNRIEKLLRDLLEKWQSGRLRQSWKLLTVTGPGVRIPLSPQRKTETIVSVFFLLYGSSKVPTFERDRKQKKHKRSTRALVFLCRTPPKGINEVNPFSNPESPNFRKRQKAKKNKARIGQRFFFAGRPQLVSPAFFHFSSNP